MSCLCNNRCTCNQPVERNVTNTTNNIPVPGKSAYEIWLQYPGNEGKTELEFLESNKVSLTYAKEEW